MIDAFDRKIHYARVSVTDLCDLKCKYCMPETGVDKKNHDDILRIEELYDVIESLVELGIDKVRLTGGEPLVRKGIVNLVEKVGALEGIKDLTMTTNGQLLKKYAKPLKEAGLNRVNISLDTLDPVKYKDITRGGNLERVLDGIELAKEVGLTPIKINVVLINGFNTDEIEAFMEMAGEEVDVRFIELMPIGEAATWNKEKFVSNSEVIEKYKHLLVEDISVKSGPAKYYKKISSGGLIGFINPISSHFCEGCNRIRITADGNLKTCLHSDVEVPLRPHIPDKAALKEVVLEAVDKKPLKHHINDAEFIPITRDMHRIGG